MFPCATRAEEPSCCGAPDSRLTRFGTPKGFRAGYFAGPVLGAVREQCSRTAGTCSSSADARSGPQGKWLIGEARPAQPLKQVVGVLRLNWDLGRKRMLLRKAYDALPPGGALIVYERLIDDARSASATGLLSSLNMLIMTAGGFDFTAAECIGWMRDAGFREMRTEPLADAHAMIVAVK
jgi:hypothetical protein